MALTATLYDFQVALSHVDRRIEQQLSFKVARHPSETLERLWLRVLAYCWQFEERLEFGKGLSDPDEPDLATRDYTGQVTRWIRVGKPEPEKIHRAVTQNSGAQVVVLFESPERLQAFLAEAAEQKLTRVSKAQLAAVDPGLLERLAEKDERRAKLTLTLVGDHFYVDRDGESLDGPLTLGPSPG